MRPNHFLIMGYTTMRPRHDQAAFHEPSSDLQGPRHNATFCAAEPAPARWRPLPVAASRAIPVTLIRPIDRRDTSPNHITINNGGREPLRPAGSAGGGATHALYRPLIDVTAPGRARRLPNANGRRRRHAPPPSGAPLADGGRTTASSTAPQQTHTRGQ